jgi:hypothetical protein
MDSAAYIRTFQSTMKARAKDLTLNLQKKRMFDRKPFAQIRVSDAMGMQDLIGRDGWFRSGKKRRQQSIRHQMWKIRHSIAFFNAHQGRYYQQLVKNDYRDQVVAYLSPAASAEAQIFISDLDQLDKIYDLQIFMLDHRDKEALSAEGWAEYQRLVAQEQQIWSRIGNRKKQMIYLLQEVKKELQRTAEDAKKNPRSFGAVVLIEIKAACLSMTTLTLLGIGTFFLLLGAGINTNGYAYDDWMVAVSWLITLVTYWGAFKSGSALLTIMSGELKEGVGAVQQDC